MKRFDISADLSQVVKRRKVERDGNQEMVSYISWITALGLARTLGMDTAQELVEWEPGVAVLSMLGGMIVGIRQGDQEVYLPVLNRVQEPMPDGQASSRVIEISIARCRSKTIGCCTGVGLSVYAGFGGDGREFASRLGEIGFDTDLANVVPIIKARPGETAKDVPYVPWPAAVAAAKLADPAFKWWVEQRDAVDTSTGEVTKRPFVNLGTGYAVGVTVLFRGVQHTEWLPVLGKKRNGDKVLYNRPITNPNVKQWNTSVMRCLARGIAITSGYGIDLYAKADLNAVINGVDEETSDAEEPAEEPVETPEPHVPEPVAEMPVVVIPPRPAPRRAEPAASVQAPVVHAPMRPAVATRPPAQADESVAAMLTEIRVLAAQTRTKDAAVLFGINNASSYAAVTEKDIDAVRHMRGYLRAKRVKTKAAAVAA
ncbi:MAG TPA: DUF1071 domain-containing protein [Nevskiaceae bacterium]|nr:DUF1071 domain-containing protein [Nevskiaceae bacterium]